MQFSKKSLSIPPSATLALTAKAKTLKDEGKDIVEFGAGQPDFDTPDYIKEAAKEALDRGMTKYTPVSGIPQLRKAICEKLKKDNGLDYQPNQIMVTNGAKHALYNAFQALLNPGDEVLIPTPYWNSYPEIVKMADGVPVFVESGESSGFKVTPEQVAAAITPKTKAIILNSPSNPTGAVYDAEELTALGKVLAARPVFVVTDEIYERFLYDGMMHHSIVELCPELKEKAIVINGVSKTFAMTGWRIGYAASPKEVAGIMNSIQGNSTSNPNSIAQWASLAALKNGYEEVEKMRKTFEERRDLAVSLINKTPGISCVTPKGAFYIMLNISEAIGMSFEGKKIGGSLDYCDLLLEHFDVAAVPGVAFGSDDHIRISYATDKESIQKGLERIAQFMAQLSGNH
jgi:aspartate aminotransferase